MRKHYKIKSKDILIHGLADLFFLHDMPYVHGIVPRQIEALSYHIYDQTEFGGTVSGVFAGEETDENLLGIVLHSSVEGSDAEFKAVLSFPFTLKQWNDAWYGIAVDVDIAWQEAHDETD